MQGNVARFHCTRLTSLLLSGSHTICGSGMSGFPAIVVNLWRNEGGHGQSFRSVLHLGLHSWCMRCTIRRLKGIAVAIAVAGVVGRVVQPECMLLFVPC
jgi:hypothetical protein